MMVFPKHSKRTEKRVISSGRQLAQPGEIHSTGASVERMLDTPERVIQLQRLIGNQAVRRIIAQQSLGVIQRFPGRSGLVARFGEPHRVGSKRYKRLLDAAQAYRDYATATTIARTPNELRSQFTKVARLLDAIEDCINRYEVTNNPSSKTRNILTLRDDLKQERSYASKALIRFLSRPPSLSPFASRPLTISGAINTFSDDDNTVTLDPASQGASQQGGMNSVTEYTADGGTDNARTGFFKETKNTLYDPVPGENPERVREHITDEMEEALRGVSDATTRERITSEFMALQTEYDFGVDTLGIDSADARMTNRDVAMSLIDSLLDSGVIARAQFAILNVPGAQKQGGFMEKAKGQQASDLKQQGRFAKNQADKGDDANKINAEDPELMRLLSRLQLIDLLCLQIDRGLQNYFIQTDSRGNILRVTGIDNDLALGRNVGNESGKFDQPLRTQQLPGISRFVDKELADRIIKLDPSLLRLLLMNLLSPEEISALLRRLTLLQAELKKSQTKLLKPEQWQRHLQAVIDEGKSYASVLRNDLNWDRN